MQLIHPNIDFYYKLKKYLGIVTIPSCADCRKKIESANEQDDEARAHLLPQKAGYEYSKNILNSWIKTKDATWKKFIKALRSLEREFEANQLIVHLR